ncbi:MAG: ATP-binding protein [Anaerolineae bacterium]
MQPGSARLVSTIADDQGLSAARLAGLQTAVAEAVMNAMEHGNHFCPELPVDVHVLSSTESLVVRITDRGSGPRVSTTGVPAEGTEAAGETQTVILNFSDVSYMNSSGIGLLVTLLIRANRNGHTLLAYGLNDHYRRVFELTKLSEAIQVFDDEAAALAAAGVA